MEQVSAFKKEVQSLEASKQELQGEKVSLEVRMAELEEQREGEFINKHQQRI